MRTVILANNTVNHSRHLLDMALDTAPMETKLHPWRQSSTPGHKLHPWTQSPTPGHKAPALNAKLHPWTQNSTPGLTYKDRHNDNIVCLIVQNVEQHYQGLEYVEEHAANRQSFETLAAAPKLNICTTNKQTNKQTGGIKASIYASYFFLPFLKARNSNMLWRILTAIVRARRYGFVSRRVVWW